MPDPVPWTYSYIYTAADDDEVITFSLLQLDPNDVDLGEIDASASSGGWTTSAVRMTLAEGGTPEDGAGQPDDVHSRPGSSHKSHRINESR